jgi:hypothetical protein
MELTEKDINKYGTEKEKNFLKEGKKSWYKNDQEKFDIQLKITAHIEKYDKNEDPIEYTIFKEDNVYRIKADIKEILDEGEDFETIRYKWFWQNQNEPDYRSKGYWDDAESAITNLFYET